MGTSTESRKVRRKIVDLPVGSKLLIGFGALTLLLTLVIACLVLTVNRLGTANEIVGVANARSQAADQLRFAAADMRAAQQAYVLGGDTNRPDFDRSLSRFEAALDTLRNTAVDPVEHALIQKIATGYQTFLATDQLIWSAFQEDHFDLARNLTLGAENLDFGFMADDATQYSTRAENSRVDAVERFHKASNEARSLGVGLGVVALLVMTVASWWITKLIRDPLHKVQLAAERAAEGDLDAVADVHGDDETGRLARAFNSMLAKLRLREETLLADHRRQETAGRVHRALEMADDEVAALGVIGLTIAEVLPGRSAELLLADNSKANLEQAIVAGPHPDGPGCPVASPFSCVAVRSGSAVTFSSSNSLDACPHLRDRGETACSAVCVPVTFMGRAMGVIHAVDVEHAVPDPVEIDALTMLSTQAGARIGMLRTMVRTSEQASIDSLTGLMNRRNFQTRIRSMRRAGTPFALVMADIDHFKRVNDAHGHETGDRALKTFADVARSSLREGDLIARWGGEEFSFAFVNLDPQAACSAIDRIRLELAGRLSTSDLPRFTVSFGVVSADACASLEDAVRHADDALYLAKARGRDCSVIADTNQFDEEGMEIRPLQRVVEKVRSSSAHGVLATLARDDDPMDR
jgi:diguanylate cyclase (GGDEF)-like protein